MNKTITKVLPHRPPFLFVDEIIEQKYMEYAKGLKRVTDTEFWCKGHFPDNPIFPGVLILETMAQIGGFIFDNINTECDCSEFPNKKFAYLSKVNSFTIRKKVVPGDILDVEVNYAEAYGPYVKVIAKATVKNKIVAKAEIVYTFLDKL